MGLRDWFKSAVSTTPPSPPNEPTVDEEAIQRKAFAKLQQAKTDEARSLFDDTEMAPEEEATVAAPYDASDASVEDLMGLEDESFTHLDEVEVVDVTSLEDPYLRATVEGDISQAVNFGEEENDPSV